MGELKFDEFLNIEDLAKQVGVSIRYLHDEIKRGNLKAMKIGRRLKFEQQEVIRWVKKKTV